MAAAGKQAAAAAAPAAAVPESGAPATAQRMSKGRKAAVAVGAFAAIFGWLASHSGATLAKDGPGGLLLAVARVEPQVALGLGEAGDGRWLPLKYVVMWIMLHCLMWAHTEIRLSCKKISLLHCVWIFVAASWYLAGNTHFVNIQQRLSRWEPAFSSEHNLISISFAYFITDMPFCVIIPSHRAFIVHHVICLLGFSLSTGALIDLTGAAGAGIPAEKLSVAKFADAAAPVATNLTFGTYNVIVLLWIAELGGVFFQVSRLCIGSAFELPTRALFIGVFFVTRIFLWPWYMCKLWTVGAVDVVKQRLAGGDVALLQSALVVDAVLEFLLLVTNIVFVYTLIMPIYKSRRLIPEAPPGTHRKWLREHHLGFWAVWLEPRGKRGQQGAPAAAAGKVVD